jgi:hypothetical protein
VNSALKLAGLLGLVLAAARLLDIVRIPWRRPWRGGDDPAFQGDGWRWTLCLLLPNVLLWRAPDGCPFTLDMLVLTRDQQESCRKEWQATQAWYAEQERRQP